jgi:hypothetical protein
LYRVTAIATPSTLPRQYVTQLNLFAGQLYLDSFPEYVELCTTIGRGLCTLSITLELSYLAAYGLFPWLPYDFALGALCNFASLADRRRGLDVASMLVTAPRCERSVVTPA